MCRKSVWEQPVSAETKQRVRQLCAIDQKADVSVLRVLDFGCGNGRYLEVFAEWISNGGLYGVEIDTARVAQARQKGLNCVLTDRKSSGLPFRDESFHIVFSSNVVEHIPRGLYFECLLEIQRVLSSGGRFVIGTPNYPAKRAYDLLKALTTHHHSYYLFDDPTHVNKMSIRRLERDLKDVFSEVHLEIDHLLLEDHIPWLRRADIRHLLRAFGDKTIGYCER